MFVKYFSLILFFVILLVSNTLSQTKKELQLTVNAVITMAQENSLTALRIKNDYLASYWQYKSYKASRLPALHLRSNPFTYNRNVIKEFNALLPNIVIEND